MCSPICSSCTVCWGISVQTTDRIIARAVQAWITAVRAQTAYITPGSPLDNGYRHIFVRPRHAAFLQFYYAHNAS
jgi:hypothetical protein